MNGSTSNNVGFNIENTVRLCSEIGASYTSCKKALSKIITTIGYMVFDPAAGGYSNDYGWFSDEAVAFYRNEFELVSKDLSNALSATYNDYYLKVQDAIGKWCATTGVREVPNVGMQHESPIGVEWKEGMFLGYPVKNRDNNGNIRISRILGEELNKYKTTIKREFDIACEEAVKIISKTTMDSFFGMGQQQALIDRVKKSMANIQNETIMLTSSIIAEVNAAVQKYESIAKQIAAGFNNAIESATAAVNNGQ